MCIPTYNRKEQLLEIINTVLSLQRDDINVVVTDNCSTDGTEDELKKIKDSRLRYYKNEAPIPAMNNMIQSIFNGDGDYIFYCNDRDIILLPGFLALIHLIEREEFTFIQTERRQCARSIIGKSNKRGRNSEEISIYRHGFDSLMHQEFTNHPTGMVYNGKIIRKHLKRENYFKYLKDMWSFSFLMRDVLMYGEGKSARFAHACWDERSVIFVAENKSGTVVGGVLFFYPEVPCILVKDTLEQTLKINDYGMSDEEKIKVGIRILRHFYESLIDYKYKMSSIRETMHYGIERRFVSTPEMTRIFQKYFYFSLNFLEEQNYPKELCREWEKMYASLLRRMIYLSCKADLVIPRWVLGVRRELRKYKRSKGNTL